jgi:ATP-dependent 26S proteasome regulatory subunit
LVQRDLVAICYAYVLIQFCSMASVRLNIREQQKAYDQSEEDLKAIQSVGQIIGEVLKQLDDERCELGDFNSILGTP